MSAFDNIKRVIVPQERFRSEEIAPGVLIQEFYPGGKEGPNREIHFDTPGGQAWTEYLLLGDDATPFQVMIPDIRMPPNQLWPLHWHDAWTVVLVLEGGCIVGDWYMRPGDVFITEPSIEYGPLLIGPHGCRLLEIFAQAHLADGGYGPEFADHPTLKSSPKNFLARSPLNQRNNGRQMLSLDDDVEGITKTRLTAGARWDLGKPSDPERGIMGDTRLAAGEVLDPHSYGDWHFLLVLDGSLTIAGRTVAKDGFIIAAPGSKVDRIQAGANGAQLLELARTAAGAERMPA